MSKHVHEIRDPIHGFVRLDDDERRVLDSRPFQRLRHIHQLALTYLLYPAATHKRFEHSLGVLEVAGRVFDVVTHPANVSNEIRHLLPDLADEDKLRYWRRVLRMAALCHDTGHLPFSHAAERELLPEGWDHERLTREIILSPEMRSIWSSVTPPLRALDIVKLAVGPRKGKDLDFSTWEALLAEIITGDAFGADRMDYLLRDSHHIGVAYGKFDLFRLIDTLRMLPRPRGEQGGSAEPALGIEAGGIHSAEALMLARYFMYSQVYFHPIRRIYDIHLKDFLAVWLPGGRFPIDLEEHLGRTDNEVLAALGAAARDPAQPGHAAAQRIVGHDHFRRLYQPLPAERAKDPNPGQAIFAAAKAEFGADMVRHDEYTQPRDWVEFPVRTRDGYIVLSWEYSAPLTNVPLVAIDTVFIHPEKQKDAQRWLEANRAALLDSLKEEAK
jgi:HD superfamily phosphohydrolase